MEKVVIVDNNLLKKASGFLLDKSIWIWWVFYVALTGVLFGISNLALYLLGIEVWIGIIVLILFGIIWGTVNYFKLHGKLKAAEKAGQSE